MEPDDKEKMKSGSWKEDLHLTKWVGCFLPDAAEYALLSKGVKSGRVSMLKPLLWLACAAGLIAMIALRVSVFKVLLILLLIALSLVLLRLLRSGLMALVRNLAARYQARKIEEHNRKRPSDRWNEPGGF